ncbi:J domain-containing protein [Gemmata palustris]|uniref:J domain-containing protein n=1 Tax=Gemmata palustris TaxID=2822762 RepID=UPI0028F4579C|nr:J domain-containing protein [Gemmata palustris]
MQSSLRRFSADSGKKVESVLVSSNVTLMDRNPKDAGVAVYFTWDGISTCIAVDRYQRIEENLQAIHHVIEAERTKLRHGGLNLVRAAFRGYAALPPPQTSKADPCTVLGVKRGATVAEIEAAYREKAKKAHPDAGGSHNAMADLNAARDALLGQKP